MRRLKRKYDSGDDAEDEYVQDEKRSRQDSDVYIPSNKNTMNEQTKNAKKPDPVDTPRQKNKNLAPPPVKPIGKGNLENGKSTNCCSFFFFFFFPVKKHSTAVKMSVGKMSVGKMTAGNMSAGKKSAVKMSAGKNSAGKNSAGINSADNMSAGKMSAGKMSAGKLIAAAVRKKDTAGKQRPFLKATAPAASKIRRAPSNEMRSSDAGAAAAAPTKPFRPVPSKVTKEKGKGKKITNC